MLMIHSCTPATIHTTQSTLVSAYLTAQLTFRAVCIVDKTEVIWVGSKQNLATLQHHDVTVTVGTEAIQPVDVMRNLGVWMDRELSMKQHEIKVAGACFHQLRHLQQIRRCVGLEVTTQLVLALVISRLDYCNSVLAGLPASTVNILQRVQNAAARLVCQLKPREHVTPSLQQLHVILVASETTSAVQTLHDYVRCPPRLSSVIHH